MQSSGKRPLARYGSAVVELFDSLVFWYLSQFKPKDCVDVVEVN
jgi:hypothetical protein